MIHPYLMYCNIAWGCAYKTNLDNLFKLQKRAVRLISNTSYLAHTSTLFCRLGILKIFDIYKFQTLCFIYKYRNRYPGFSEIVFANTTSSVHNTRQINKMFVPRYRTNVRGVSIKISGPQMWNKLPPAIVSSESIFIFKSLLTQHLKKFLFVIL